ncbi:hypothetical protein DPMN_059929, partial [Dreissena polymorpha]
DVEQSPAPNEGSPLRSEGSAPPRSKNPGHDHIHQKVLEDLDIPVVAAEIAMARGKKEAGVDHRCLLDGDTMETGYTTRPVIFVGFSHHRNRCNVTNRGVSERQENLGDVSATVAQRISLLRNQRESAQITAYIDRDSQMTPIDFQVP